MTRLFPLPDRFGSLVFGTLCGLLLAVPCAHAQQYKTGATVGPVTVASSIAGTQLVAEIRAGVSVVVPAGAGVAVWVARLDGTCSAALTSAQGIRLSAGQGREYLVTDGWRGQLCAVLESAGSVAVSVNSW